MSGNDLLHIMKNIKYVTSVWGKGKPRVALEPIGSCLKGEPYVLSSEFIINTVVIANSYHCMIIYSYLLWLNIQIF
jgi:hypothetical protein